MSLRGVVGGYSGGSLATMLLGEVNDWKLRAEGTKILPGERRYPKFLGDLPSGRRELKNLEEVDPQKRYGH